MNRYTILLSNFLLLTYAFANAQSFKVTQPNFKKDTFNIVKYGAVADGITLNSKAIQATIDACNAKGGGVVLVPGGFFLTGPIELKSNVNLHIKRDAVLQFTEDFNEYKLIQTNWEGLDAYRNQSPLSASNAINIAVTGSGIVDGNGDAWRMMKKDKLTGSQWKNKVASGGVLSEDGKTWYPSAKSLKGNSVKNPGVIASGATLNNVEEYKDFLRPNLVVFTRCKNVMLDGVTFQNSPAWNLHPSMCENLTVRNVYAKNPWYAQNGDGIDIESCKNFLIENSTFDVGDDGICIKSGRDAEGRKRNMPTENGIIRNCIVYHAHGGFVIGSEMSGGAKNLYVSNCTFIGTDIGLRFKTTRGRGGVVEKIYVNNIRMKDIAGEAILFDMYYAAKDPVPMAGEKRELPKVEFKSVDETTPVFKDFYVKDVVCTGAEKGIFIRGIPEMHIKNINLENMTLLAKKGVDIQEATGINIKNVNIISKENNPLLYVLNSDAVVFDKVQYKAADVLLQVEGDRSGGILIKNTDIKKAKKVKEVGFGTKEENITIQ
jgi:polygalacturonase